jgi:hypothetical protein
MNSTALCSPSCLVSVPQSVFLWSWCFLCIARRVAAADVPLPFKGAAIGMITAGLMSLAFMGFSGFGVSLMSIVAGVIALAVLALLFGGLLGFAAVRFRVEKDPIVEQIDHLLPQTSADNVVTQAAVPTRKPSPTVTTLINVRQVANIPLTNWLTY